MRATTGSGSRWTTTENTSCTTVARRTRRPSSVAAATAARAARRVRSANSPAINVVTTTPPWHRVAVGLDVLALSDPRSRTVDVGRFRQATPVHRHWTVRFWQIIPTPPQRAALSPSSVGFTDSTGVVVSN